MSLCKDCTSGVHHEGQAEGKTEKIAGIDCYLAIPPGDYDKTQVVFFLTDAIGISLNNNKLLADDIARNGYRTVVPDLFNGDAVPEDAFTPSSKFDITTWLSHHGADVWTPIVDKVVAVLKEEGVTRIATTGYCYGAAPSFYLACSNTSVVTVVSHPSLLKLEDLRYRSLSKAPLLINSCEVDHVLPKELQAKADVIFKSFAPAYERTYWDGCTHGFAVRGDMSDPKVKAGKEGAFEAMIKFFNKYL